ncbi:MAG: hypothetical protein ACF8XB_01425 [Planctomycetota bacterium JB042]
MNVRTLLPLAAVAAAFLTVAASPAGAASDAAVLRIERSTVTVGEQALLLLDVFGECAVDPEPRLPEIADVELAVLAGPEFSVRSGSAEAGGQEYIASYRIGAIPRRPGRFAIEGVGVVCQSDRRLDANRVDLTAVRAGDVAPVRLRLEPRAQLVRARQPFRVVVRLEVDARIANALTARSARFLFPWWGDVVNRVEGTALLPSPNGQKRFEIEGVRRSLHLDFAARPREIDGVQYEVMTGELEMLAPEPGVLTFEGTRFRCVVPTGTGTPGSGGVEGRTIEAVAETTPVTVREVPREGRPAGYGSAVGRFTIEVDVDRTTARVGDPIRVTLAVREAEPGTTNLATAEFPGLDRAAGFRRFDHRTRIERGVSYVELDLMAESADVDRLPPFTIHWFDPETATFESASTPPVPMTVTPHPDRRSLRDDGDPARPTTPLRLWPYGVAVLFLALLLGIARRARTTTPAPPRVAAAEAERRRATALATLESAPPPSEDPVEEAKALARYLAARLDSEPGRCYGEGARELLTAAGASPDLVADVTAWFEEKERAAFAGDRATGKAESAKELARRVEEGLGESGSKGEQGRAGESRGEAAGAED